MTNWKRLRGKKGQGSANIVTSRFDSTTWLAMSRVAAQAGIKLSVLIYTAVLGLPEVKKEIRTIKQERRGERRDTKQVDQSR